MKLNKENVKVYISKLAENFNEEIFKKAAEISDEAFEDTWHEMGCDD